MDDVRPEEKGRRKRRGELVDWRCKELTAVREKA